MDTMTVPGLIIINDFLSQAEEEWLIEEIYNQQWTTNRNGTRRIQIYGPYFDRRYKLIPGKFSEFPDFIEDLAALVKDRLKERNIPVSEKLGNHRLSTAYINEYKPGQSLQQHFDHRTTYEEHIIGISCINAAKMCFSNGRGQRLVDIPARSLYIMTGKSRFNFKHGIPNTTKDRCSVTFRTVTA